MERKRALGCSDRFWQRLCLAVAGLMIPISLQAQDRPIQQPKVMVEENGTVDVPPENVPVSSFLSPEAKAYVEQHLKDMQNPNVLRQENGVPVFLIPYVQRDHELFAVDRREEKIGGIHVYDYRPKSRISARNKDRVLINLHGGGFVGCWPGCAELESIPVAALGKLRVISIDYRQGPDNKFPAASEDVATVYQELLKTYKPRNIGIYGCSSGGMQTAMSVAWFHEHALPMPGAIGIFCASAGGFSGGDSSYTAMPMGEGRLPQPALPGSQPSRGYFSDADPKDPLVSPINAPEILAKFPPTLIISGSRGFELSSALYTHEQLAKLGVQTDLHVWEGLFHGFFYNADIPESNDAFQVMIGFFDRYLGTGTKSLAAFGVAGKKTP